jgi:hypothetical protein
MFILKLALGVNVFLILPPCGNCKQLGHTKGACPEPDYSESEKEKKWKHLMFTNDRVASIL